MSVKSIHRFSLLSTAVFALLSPVLAIEIPGGVVETSEYAATRAAMKNEQLAGFLPERGRFTFPAPYNTAGIRLTNASDCGGADCIRDVAYSYWRNMNNHVGSDQMLIFVGTDMASGPALIQYNKVTDEVTASGPVFPASSPYSASTGEGFYFSANMPSKLYVGMGPVIERFDVLSKEIQTIVNVNAHLGGDHYLWQRHSSDDDNVHSATVRNSASYEMLGCMVYQENIARFSFFRKKGEYDECQIDKSGKWLVIKEDMDGADGEDNRIINVQTGEERVLLDRDGAGGHSDLGHGYMLASDNWSNDANAVKMWNLNAPSLNGVLVYKNNDWNTASPAHISHTNARADLPPEQQIACGSSANAADGPGANETVCFRLDGSRQMLAVAPAMTDVNRGKGDSYTRMPKGNLDVTGQYFIWTSNLAGNRTDAFLVKVPTHRLGGQAGATQRLSLIGNKLPDRFTMTKSGAPTSAVIQGGAFVNNNSYTESITAPQVAVIEAAVVPEPAHIGQPAQILLVVKNAYADAFVTIDGAGELIRLEENGNPATFRELAALQSYNPVILHHDVVDERYRGTNEIYVGYRLYNGGEIYFNAESINLTVN
jgi:hypothetical protein